jgi:hypothetical protein
MTREDEDEDDEDDDEDMFTVCVGGLCRIIDIGLVKSMVELRWGKF